MAMRQASSMANDSDAKKPARTSRSEARLRQSLEELSSPHVVVRRKAAKRLGKRGNTDAIEPLCKTLEDTDRFVRRWAALSLGQIGAPLAIEALCQRVLSNRSVLVQRAAITALGQIGSARALDPLCRALQNRQIAWDATEALIKIACPAVLLLAERLNGPEGSQRAGAEQALRQLANHKPPQALLAVITDFRVSAGERSLCLEVLRERLGLSKRLNASRSSAQRFCEQALKSQNDAVRKGARELLDYLTLGRAGQQGFTIEQAILLRAAEGRATTEDTGQLLRASDSAETPGESLETSRPTLLDRL